MQDEGTEICVKNQLTLRTLKCCKNFVFNFPVFSFLEILFM